MMDNAMWIISERYYSLSILHYSFTTNYKLYINNGTSQATPLEYPTRQTQNALQSYCSSAVNWCQNRWSTPAAPCARFRRQPVLQGPDDHRELRQDGLSGFDFREVFRRRLSEDEREILFYWPSPPYFYAYLIFPLPNRGIQNEPSQWKLQWTQWVAILLPKLL